MTPRFHNGSEAKYSLSFRSASEASHAADAADFELRRAWIARSSASRIADAWHRIMMSHGGIVIDGSWRRGVVRAG